MIKGFSKIISVIEILHNPFSFFIVECIPIFFFFIKIRYLVESPRFLISKNNFSDALSNIKYIAH